MSKLIEKARARLHAQGGRMTPQRRLILEALEHSGVHPTAEQVLSTVKQQDPTLNLSTVYRTLRWLEAEELISTRLFNEGRLQERFDAVMPHEHHHFMCTICKDVIEFDTDLIEKIKLRLEVETGVRVEHGSIVFYGLCARCRRKQTGSELLVEAA
jgi:Fe2+ or Zn2+ uptake regulation protein